MKQKTIFMIADPSEWVGKLKTEMQDAVHSELDALNKQKKQQPDEYLTSKEVCERLRCSSSTLRRRTNKGDLRVYAFGRKHLYKSTDVEAALIQLTTKGGCYGY
ncbi:hypothetical protein EZS27_024557 [termite gut metagenome]|uniref:Helix-turn-helix domain-containing protein n=1 Tax=termite gut metagenome TaxID=433724 RepID=A0A5J4QWU0_9ZZZZ